ncbi:thioesterase family protein [Fulvivirga sediminis]|uniref:Fluoroacetyl-CoA-specific thioesterase-like domain-containing protein n=1 Tax=Fulvivirga sediminis TaxID=2803949 RepID=A0A937F810_9BACT|nr:hypothetical protein [Fulvivirga sediminis]MBL3657425.1 hypothetical protein [Fulvivirga sediminis]
MKNLFQPGDIKIYRRKITEEDVASFHGKIVHHVCSTFSLARDIEWTSRLFVLDICDHDEEGIGTQLEIKHLSPALVGDEITISAILRTFEENELMCDYVVKVGERKVAEGKTGQKILKKNRIKEIFSTFE